MKRLLFCFCLLCTLLFSQAPSQDPLQVQAQALLNKKQFAEAIPLLEQLRINAAQTSQWELYKNNTIGLVKARPDKKDFEIVHQLLSESLSVFKNAGLADAPASAELWMWLAVRLRNVERYPEALTAYINALRIYDNHGIKGKDVALCYKNAAQIWTRWNNYPQADDYLKAALEVDSDTGKYVLSTLAQLVNNAYWQDSLMLANYYFEKASQLPKKTNVEALADLWYTGTLLFTRLSRLEQATVLVKKALAYHGTHPDVDKEHHIRCLSASAEIAVKKNNSRMLKNCSRKLN